MKQRQKIINFLAVFVILVGGAFLTFPQTSYAGSCTATYDCGGGAVCSCSGTNCGFPSDGGCYASTTSGTISCTCPSDPEK